MEAPAVNTYARNMSVISRRWPEVAKAIQNATLDGCQWQEGTKEGTIVYNGIRMTGAVDRAAEAKLQASTVAEGTDIQWCFGVGLGELPRELLKRNRKTVVAVLNASVTKASLSQTYQADWLEHRKVDMCLASSLVDTIRVPQNAPFTVVPMELRYADKGAYPVRDMVFGAINSRFNVGIQYQAQLSMDTAHWEENKQYMAVDKSVTKLFGEGTSSIIVVASGPSLDGQLDWLRNQEHAQIICMNSSLPVLVKAGILPDICIVLDSAKTIPKCMDGLELPDPNPIALVYEPVVSPSLVSVWPGQRYFSVTHDLWHQGTVTHAAVDLAVKMGAKSITLLGADFCHPSMKSHAGDAPDHYTVHETPAAMMPTVNGLGEDTHTIPCLAMYHRTLEEYVGKHPEVAWFKRGKQGVTVKGAEWQGS